MCGYKDEDLSHLRLLAVREVELEGGDDTAVGHLHSCIQNCLKRRCKLLNCESKHLLACLYLSIHYILR